MNKKLTLILSMIMAVAMAQGALAYCAGGFPDFYSGDLLIGGSDAPAGTEANGQDE